MATGQPLQIVDVTADHKFQLNEDLLKSVLYSAACKNRKVVVVSIAGAFRKGKSFMLDFFLRYLRSSTKHKWLGDNSEPLTGFHWRGGFERDTTGILMWSEPFITTTPDNEQVAVLLMDTQGAFDSQSTVKDCATVFALSLMVSSVHIFNVTQNLQEDDLQHLNLFAEYGALALNSCHETPFQQLTFLVRDWSYPYEANYGYAGGEVLLNKRMKITAEQHEELQLLRRRLKECFKLLNCFLMPHPGLKVATNPDFDGRLSDVENEFCAQLEVLVPSLFSPEKLQLKEINGDHITGQQLLEYFKAYCKVFETDELPHPKAVLQATAEANNLAAKAAAKDNYCRLMEQQCGGDRPYMHPEHLKALHSQARDNSMHHFRDAKKMGGETLSEKYLDELVKELDDLYLSYVKHNDGKNIFAFSRTPSIFLGAMILSYLLSWVMEAVWLNSVSSLLKMVFWASFASLITWLYCKYSGDFKDFGDYFDNFADTIWNTVCQPIYQQFLQASVRSIVASATEHSPGQLQASSR